MEWMYELLWDVFFAVLGTVCTAVAAELGKVLASFWKDKSQNEAIRSIADTCVSAVQMMYRDLNGDQKLCRAMEMASELLEEKGIRLSEERIRICLESALASFRGAFEKT